VKIARFRAIFRYKILGACFEIKAVSNLVDDHRAQLLNYLYATGFKVGLVVNFGHFPKIEHERFVI